MRVTLVPLLRRACRRVLVVSVVLLAAVLPTAAPVAGDESYRPAVVQGRSAVAGEAPSVVRLSLVYADADGDLLAYGCTGTLVAPRVVLTAAHCLPTAADGTPRPTLSAALVGSVNTNAQRAVPVESWEGHPSFSTIASGSVFDLAVVRLAADAGVPVSPVLPPDRASLLTTWAPVTAYGFGFVSWNQSTQTGVRATVLQVADLEVWPDVSGGGQLVAGSYVTTMCYGDSGGPLFLTVDGVPTVVGVTSTTQTGCPVPSWLGSRFGRPIAAWDWLLPRISVTPPAPPPTTTTVAPTTTTVAPTTTTTVAPTTTTTVAPTTTTTTAPPVPPLPVPPTPMPPPPTAPPIVLPFAPPSVPVPSGYWLLDRGGSLTAFGDAPAVRSPALTTDAVKVAAVPTGGALVLDAAGTVHAVGGARWLGNVPAADLQPDERATTVAPTPTGAGYYVFTSRGRAFVFGDAVFRGDLRASTLNGPVIDASVLPDGRGYFLVAADGGIFAFGTAEFRGSMGGRPLNAPVVGLVPDGDGRGYWLVAADGGVFAFDAPFRGSMGGQRMNAPVVGLVRYGDGYLMVGADGGVFTFSTLPFRGSLGGAPPARPVVAIASLPG